MSVSLNLLDANTSSMETDATGWTAGANTTRARSTAGSYAGVASLSLVATAAGTVTATTAARVPVTPGAEYTAYAYFGGLQATAGRTVTVQLNFYAGASGGTALQTSTSAAQTLPASATWATPPPIVVASAPSPAAYVSVTVTATGITAGGGVLVDAVAAGPTALMTGNLLSYGTQGSETGVTGWQSITNATVDRTSALSYEGWWSLRLTSVAAGAMEARTVTAFPVTAGSVYNAYGWVQPSAAGLEFKAQIIWYDAGGAAVGARETYSWFASAATWTKCTVIGTAPVGAVTAKVAFAPTATAAGQTWSIDQISASPAPISAGNMLGYRDQSFETDVSGWTALSGCTITRSTAQQWDGQGSMQLTGDGTGDAIVRLTANLPVTPRKSYKISPHLYHPSTTLTGNVIVYLLFAWLDANGDSISTNSVSWNTGTGAGWYSPSGSAVAPAGAVYVAVGLRILGVPSGATRYVDSISVTNDGLGVIADLVPDAYGARITMQGMTTGSYSYWSLSRMLPDGTLTPVRGSAGDLTKVPLTGDLAVAEDYEAPLGVPVVYYLKLYTGSSYLAYAADSITLPEPPDNSVVIKDPGLPARHTTAVVQKGGLPDWQRAARQGINPVRGRSRPIVISDVRTSRTGSMTLVTETADDLAAMWWLLETGNTLLIQWPTEWGEVDAYVSIGDVTEAHIAEYAAYSDRTWSVPLTEVDRPVGGITGSASRTWQTVMDENADWLSVLTTYSSWLDVYTGVEGA